MNKYELINETNNKIEEIEVIEKFVDFALNYLKLENVLFNIIIVSDEKIKELNRVYRKKDSITDVISFALEDDTTFIKTDFRVLGDIYICYSKIISQANLYGHSFKREFAFLIIHGLLHLLGYDHMTKEDENVMFSLQEVILNEFGIKREN